MTESLQQLTELAEQAAATSLLSLLDDDVLTRLDLLHAAEQIVHAAKLKAIREADGRNLAAKCHASSANSWLRNRLRVSVAEAGRLLHNARILDDQPALQTAMTGGRLNTEQLTVISRTLRDLPKNLAPQVRADAATALAGHAQTLEPAALRIVGERVLAHIAPEVDDQRDERRLRELERDARERRFFTLIPTGDGTVRLNGLLDAESAAVITAALDPLCSPKQAARELAATGEARTPAQRRADALVDVFRVALTGTSLPATGGDRPQLTVSTSYDVLTRRLGPGRLENGERVCATTVRRLACDARILPLVLGGRSQILDAGHSRRLVSTATRRVLAERDRGCAFPNCDRPARWCEAHHLIAWSAGGPTNTENLALLCSFHHHLLHDDTNPATGWQARPGPDGHPEFLPPPWLDPSRKPLRNTYHHRE